MSTLNSQIKKKEMLFDEALYAYLIIYSTSDCTMR